MIFILIRKALSKYSKEELYLQVENAITSFFKVSKENLQNLVPNIILFIKAIDIERTKKEEDKNAETKSLQIIPQCNETNLYDPQSFIYNQQLVSVQITSTKNKNVSKIIFNINNFFRFWLHCGRIVLDCCLLLSIRK
jgi:hypothetical protein